MRIACIGGGPAGLYFAISMKLRDPSHHWCYPIVRLESYLTEAGLRIEHVESAAKEMEFEPWVDRMGASAETRERVRALLAQAPEGAREFFRPQGEGTELRFSLEEAILIARK